ncbi:unnamed protein product [Arabis nemorensis]|uniref:Jacalin-type lectin domain-containing protein n=1 Tax=Arabis nemorensis TaxID=586526 RepID=A0A565BN94_9BRAS|nr:unnamed protein product [Arabis nemorensis]
MPTSTEFEPCSDDYITSVEVGITNYNHDTLSVVMLTINRTNRGIARAFGSGLIGSNEEPVLASIKYEKILVLQKRDHKILGFYGRSSKFLEEIGVYVEPINDE